MDVHPLGDHLIVGGYDRKLCWFDLELSDKPYKILRYVTELNLSMHTDISHGTISQVSQPRHPIVTLPSDISIVCVIVGRWLDPDLPCTGLQRPDDGPAYCPTQDSARASGERRTRGTAGEVGTTPTLACECRRGWGCCDLVQLDETIFELFHSCVPFATGCSMCILLVVMEEVSVQAHRTC